MHNHLSFISNTEEQLDRRSKSHGCGMEEKKVRSLSVSVIICQVQSGNSGQDSTDVLAQ